MISMWKQAGSAQIWEVSLINDGPVTLILDTEEMRTGRVDR